MIKGTVVLKICFKLFTRLHVDLYLYAVVFCGLKMENYTISKKDQIKKAKVVCVIHALYMY